MLKVLKFKKIGLALNWYPALIDCILAQHLQLLPLFDDRCGKMPPETSSMESHPDLHWREMKIRWKCVGRNDQARQPIVLKWRSRFNVFLRKFWVTEMTRICLRCMYRLQVQDCKSCFYLQSDFLQFSVTELELHCIQWKACIPELSYDNGWGCIRCLDYITPVHLTDVVCV